ncbi:putative C6 transcription factor [Tuber indicum]|nr:putative C6 transcription factor [Tuber indicum]
MAPTPPSSSGHSPQDANTQSSKEFRVVKKRNRVPLSCAPCRNRKLKCNRSHPCENCTRRGDPSTCTYASTPNGPSRARKQSAGSNGFSSDEMQSRIDRLEGLVLRLMGSGGNHVSSPPDRETSASTDDGTNKNKCCDDDDDVGMGSAHGDEKRRGEGESDEDVEEVRSALGIMKVDQGKSYYRGETHWAAILSEISEVKNFFNEVKQNWEEKLAHMKARNAGPNKLDRTGFPFSAGKLPSRQELLSLVPRRELVDLLVDGFFRNYDPIFHVLHRPTFYKQYEDFWRDPTQVDLIWLGLLMAIMCLSLKIYHYSGEEPPEISGKTQEMSYAFRLATEQCLIVGEFTKKMYIHTVQALILVCTWQTSKDHVDESWLFQGLLVRIAMCMGLHRDPMQFGSTITPSEAEIRRRIWTMICCMDVLESIKIGLPSMIRQEECDTRLPMNLHDDEVGEGVDVLPPERPREELTGVSYMIAKASMSKVYSRIVAQTSSLEPRPAYDQILKMDAEIREMHAAVPPFLRLKPTEECKDDPAWLIIQRYNLDLIAHKALATLHRPYAARAEHNPRYEGSRQKCVEAALVLLRHQAEIILDTQSTLKHARWFTEGLGCHDFLHAAMIICLDLSTQCRIARDRSKTQGEQGFLLGARERAEQYDVLEKARLIYEKQRDTSIDATKAYGVLTVMLDKIRGGPGYFDFSLGCPTEARKAVEKNGIAPTPQGSIPPTTGGTPVFATPSPSSSEAPQAPPNSAKSDTAAMSLGLVGQSVLSPNAAAAVLYSARTPGGHNVIMDDASNSEYGASPSESSSMSQFWPQSGVDIPSGLDWNEWDNFMQGINLDSNQSPAWPMMTALPGPPQQPLLNPDGTYRVSPSSTATPTNTAAASASTAPGDATGGGGGGGGQVPAGSGLPTGTTGYFVTEGMDIGSLLK